MPLLLITAILSIITFTTLRKYKAALNCMIALDSAINVVLSLSSPGPVMVNALMRILEVFIKPNPVQLLHSMTVTSLPLPVIVIPLRVSVEYAAAL